MTATLLFTWEAGVGAASFLAAAGADLLLLLLLVVLEGAAASSVGQAAAHTRSRQLC
jgi:hypothetical protein